MKTSGARSVRRRSSCFMPASVRCPVFRRLVVLALQLGVWVLVHAAVVDLPAGAADEGLPGSWSARMSRMASRPLDASPSMSRCMENAAVPFRKICGTR